MSCASCDDCEAKARDWDQGHPVAKGSTVPIVQRTWGTQSGTSRVEEGPAGPGALVRSGGCEQVEDKLPPASIRGPAPKVARGGAPV